MNKQERIIDAAFLLALKYGYDNVSIKQIQKKADVTAGAIYYYFKDKNDILLHVFNRYYLDQLNGFKEIFNAYDGSPAEKLKFVFYVHIGYDNVNKANFKFSDSDYEVKFKDYHLMLQGISHQHPEVESLFKEYDNKLLEFYKEIAQYLCGGEYINDVILGQMSLFIFSMIRGFIELCISFPNINLEKVIDKNVEIITDTLKNWKY